MSPPTNERRNESGEIGKATSILAASTFLSRILGLVRNQILSHFFGAGFVADAFIAAFTIPNALRRLFGEGALTPAFVSLFTRQLRDHRPSPESQSFLDATFSWLSLIVGVLVILGILITPPLVYLYVPEFREVEGKFELAVQLTRFLFPFLLLISWAALFMGVLNSLRKFAIPALGPAVLNVCVLMIAPALLLFFKPTTDQGIFMFSGAILIGAVAQVLIQIPPLVRQKSLPRLVWPKRDPRVVELMMLLLPSIFGMGIYQLNIIINRIFASAIPGAVSHLFYADLIIELPVSLIATSMSVAAVPSFTRLLVGGDRKALADTFSFSFSLNAALAFPATLGILLVGGPILSSLFFSGQFDQEDWQRSTECLMAYALGLPFFCLLRSLLPLFYAEKDTKTPAYAGFLALGVNFFSAWYFSKSFGAYGIALATSLSSAFNFLFLFFILWRRNPDFPWKRILLSTGKAIFASSIMGATLFGIQSIVPLGIWETTGLRVDKVFVLLALIFTAIFIYFVSAKILQLEAVNILWRRLRRARN